MMRGMADPWKHTPPHMGYHNKFDRCCSNRRSTHAEISPYNPARYQYSLTAHATTLTDKDSNHHVHHSPHVQSCVEQQRAATSPTQRDWSQSRSTNNWVRSLRRTRMEQTRDTCTKHSAHALRTPHTPSSHR